MDKYESLLKFALNAESEPSAEIDENIIKEARRQQNMSKWNIKKMPTVAAAVAMTIIVTSTTAYAAWSYMHPDKIVSQLEDYKLADAFNSKDAKFMSDTQTKNGYRVTTLGMVSGNDISDYLTTDNKGEVHKNRSYMVVAVEREDGKAIDKDAQFYVSPYIKGQNPARINVYLMNGAASWFVEDGIYYHLVECDNITAFAKQGVYLGVCDENLVESSAYKFDSNNGEITVNEEYKGLNALFEIPMDESLANEKEAEKLLNEWNIDTNEDTDCTEAEKLKSWTSEKLKSNAKLIENTVKTLKPDNEGCVQYDWIINEPDLGIEEMTSNGMTYIPMDEFEVGEINVIGGSWSDDGKYIIETCVKNADGTVTLAVYVEK